MIVQNVKTGKRRDVEPVDAAEYIATGGWIDPNTKTSPTPEGPEVTMVTLKHKVLDITIDVPQEKAEALLVADEYELATEDSGVTGEEGPDMVLVAAIKGMPSSDEQPDSWTESGKPQVDALSEFVGRKVSAAERDKAWKHIDA